MTVAVAEPQRDSEIERGAELGTELEHDLQIEQTALSAQLPREPAMPCSRSLRPVANTAAAEIAGTPVTVDIYDQTYHLRGLDPLYIRNLAEIVDSKMRAVAAGGTTVDSLRVAVLAALNIADEMVRVQERLRDLNGSFIKTESTVRDRTASLAGLLDSVLDDRKIG